MQGRNRFSIIRRKIMPKGIELAHRAQEELKARYKAKNIDPFNQAYLKAHCDEILDGLVALEFGLFRIEEQRVNSNLLWQIVGSSLSPSEHLTKDQLEILIKGRFDELRNFYKSISQSRVSRAGGSFQNHIAYILDTLKYPFEVQKIINGKPDFILPNVALYHKTPGECILVTAKRTLRERWRQIITEGFRSPQYFLVTIDEKQSLDTLKEMAGHRIYLVVPERIGQSVPIYRTSGNVISVRAFFEDYLDPAMVRWRQAGIIG
ncbi:MAG: hypothetical protein KAW00_02100 [Dehalococcoidia bacterium]|nr:hypothetical protein [Dehalococcoidia bacterium]